MELIARSTAVQLALVLLIPVCVFLLMHATGSHGLADPDALHDAQLARSIATGNGFSSRAISPLRLLFDADPASLHKPDVSTPPLSAAFTAVLFTIFGARDEAAALSSGIAYVVSGAMVFLLLLRLGSGAEAVLGAAAYALALPVARQSLSGGRALLATCLLSGAFLLLLRLTSADRARDDREATSTDTRLALATGAAFGFACLAEFYLAPVVLLMAAYVRFSHGAWARRRIVCILLGAALIVTPWIVRNAVVTRMPLFTMRQYDLVAGTWSHPGRVAFQRLDSDIPWPPLFAVGRPREMARKIVYTLGHARDDVPGYGDSVLAAIFLGGMLLPFGRRRIDAFRLCIFGAVLIQTLVGCTLLRSSAMFLPLVPVAWALGLLRLRELVRQVAARPWWAAEARRARTFGASVSAGILVVVGWPSLAAVVSRAPLTLPSGPSAAFIADATSPEEFVMTDVPWRVAWEANRTAIELCATEAELAMIFNAAPLEGIYLSRDPADVPARTRALWREVAYRSEGPTLNNRIWRAPGAPTGTVWRRTHPEAGRR
ncbi:MAG: glycosyltransferase family 39 protein [Armatimonadota bacterium]|jgi:4-amino-4-deoxy-L-arabinose transferase-like glycosyltransferase